MPDVFDMHEMMQRHNFIIKKKTGNLVDASQGCVLSLNLHCCSAIKMSEIYYTWNFLFASFPTFDKDTCQELPLESMRQMSKQVHSRCYTCNSLSFLLNMVDL